MQAGSLKQLIDVQAKVTSGTGDRGQPAYTWSTIRSGVPAHVEEMGGRKLEIARQLVPNATHQVTMRYDASITVGCRLAVGGKTLNIQQVQDQDSLHFTLMLLCTSQEAGIK